MSDQFTNRPIAVAGSAARSARGDRAAHRFRARLQSGRAGGRAVPVRPPGDRRHAGPHRRTSRRAASLTAPLKITVLPDGLLLDERPPARADAAIGELADAPAQPSDRPDDRPPRRRRRSVARLPAAPRQRRRNRSAPRAASRACGRRWRGRHIELREIDYAEVLRERSRRPSRGLGSRHRQLPAGQTLSSSTRRASAICSASRATASASPS